MDDFPSNKLYFQTKEENRVFLLSLDNFTKIKFDNMYYQKQFIRNVNQLKTYCDYKENINKYSSKNPWINKDLL
ncbi:hypothetical protein IIU_07076 [Bacillus cereus VD133]|uniref:Uncharacterized protein n=1 Tax=Bacillus cereus VD133 TaxID=1053233 RepID=A0A9W5PIZ5_BACCE|nr:hypothetical protein [Bacillus cereus]EOO23152.1 hypothetical protein IIU_07076 [Bacillus cereus VD133]